MKFKITKKTLVSDNNGIPNHLFVWFQRHDSHCLNPKRGMPAELPRMRNFSQILSSSKSIQVSTYKITLLGSKSCVMARLLWNLLERTCQLSLVMSAGLNQRRYTIHRRPVLPSPYTDTCSIWHYSHGITPRPTCNLPCMAYLWFLLKSPKILFGSDHW